MARRDGAPANYGRRLCPLLVIPLVLFLFAIWRLDILPTGHVYSRSRFDCPKVLNLNRPIDRRPDKTRFRIVTFNPEWLFLTGGHAGLVCPGPRCTWKNTNEAELHLTRIALLLGSLDADFIHLAEVEDCSVLARLIGAMRDTSYSALLIASSDTALGQNVGLLTRVDPADMRIHKKQSRLRFPIMQSRCPRGPGGRITLSKHYHMRMQVGALAITIIGVHLLAHPDNPSRCSKREAQAQIVRELVDRAIRRGDEVVVLGDFNDFDHSLTMPIGLRTPTLEIIKGGDGPQSGLFNVASLVKDPLLRYSAWWDADGDCRDGGGREHALIDHILVSQGLIGSIKNVRFAHDYEASCGDKRVSDHWPLILDLYI